MEGWMRIEEWRWDHGARTVGRFRPLRSGHALAHRESAYMTDNTRKTNGPLQHKPRSDRNVQKIIVIKLIAVVIS